MKSSSIFCTAVIAASTLITLSPNAFATSQSEDISANIESYSSKISEIPTQQRAPRFCPTQNGLCGWW